MNKRIIINTHTCEHCGCFDQIRSSDSAERELRVCHCCGRISLVNQFDAKEFLVGLIHEDITRESVLTELLTEKLAEVYSNLDFLDVDHLAKLLMRELYDEATFIVRAEDDEAVEYCRERAEAMIGAY